MNGGLLFALGHPSTIGIYKKEEKFEPTEDAVAPNGDFYVRMDMGQIISFNMITRGNISGILAVIIY